MLKNILNLTLKELRFKKAVAADEKTGIEVI